jgi:hypothetical protein
MHDLEILALFQLIPFLWYLFVGYAISYAISLLTKDKTPKIEDAEPGEFRSPTTNENVPFPVIFGTPRRQDKPIVAWWGELELRAIQKYARDKHGDREWYTVGHRYFIGWEMILCHGPIDGVKQFWVGDKIVWPDPSDTTQQNADGSSGFTVDYNQFFGGNEKDGGVQGEVDFIYGSTNQPISDLYRLTGIQGTNISARRGLCCAITNKFTVGNSPYMKTIAYLLKRTDILDDGSTQWYSAKADINGDLNAAHLLREMFTNTRWGLGYSTTLFQDAVWQPVADTLYTEGFGLSKLWSSPNESAEDVIRDVLRHIDATIYQDPSTGNIVLKLIRDDYTAANLESFDASDIIELSDFRRPSLGQIPDMYTLKFTNIIENKTNQITTHDASLISMQGGKIIPIEYEFLAITKSALAQKVLAREQNQVGSMLASMKLKCKRTMSHLLPGDVFKLTWPKLGITDMVVRVLPDAKYGTLEDGTIQFHVTEDVFSTENALYGAWPGSNWTSPISNATNVTLQKLMEQTFYDIQGRLGVSLALAMQDDAAFLVAAAAAPTTDAVSYELLLRSGDQSGSAYPEAFVSDGVSGFALTDTIQTAMPLDAVTITVSLNSIDASSVTVGSYALIGDELCKVLASGDKSVRLARGVIDTVPQAHNIGDRIWFLYYDGHYSGREFDFNQAPEAKYLTTTSDDKLTEAAATTFTAPNMDARQIRPYPPGDVQIQGQSYPTTITGGVDIVLTWAHRDRTQQLGYIVEHQEPDIGPETNVTYTIEIYNDSNNLVRTVPGITGTTWTYTTAMQAADATSADPLDNMTIELYSVRDGYTGASSGGRL